jgi:hypothetical protein
LRAACHPNGVAKRAAETFDADLHHVAFLQLHAIAETQRGGSEIMNMYVA